jgi:hypothetical protein
MDHTKSILVCALCSLLGLAVSGMSQNLLSYGDFGGGLSGWTLDSSDPLAAAVATGTGNPTPGLYLSRGTDSTHILPNGVGQIIPVVAGQKYQLRGQWMGMIMGRNGAGDPNGTAYAEINVTFLPDNITPYVGTGAPAVSMQLKKRWQSGTTPSAINVDPATGTWDWESISISPLTGNSEAIVPTAGTNYMAIWTNFACTSGNTNTTVYVNIDNLQVMSCQAFSQADLNADCQVDFKDLAVLTNTWMSCGRDPVSKCWN